MSLTHTKKRAVGVARVHAGMLASLHVPGFHDRVLYRRDVDDPPCALRLHQGTLRRGETDDA